MTPRRSKDFSGQKKGSLPWRHKLTAAVRDRKGRGGEKKAAPGEEAA